MELKVNLPNPQEMTAEQFFAQMRISLKAAEKTYQQTIKSLTEEQSIAIEELKKKNEEPWVQFCLVGIESTEEGRQKLEKIDPDFELRHKIALSINTL